MLRCVPSDSNGPETCWGSSAVKLFLYATQINLLEMSSMEDLSSRAFAGRLISEDAPKNAPLFVVGSEGFIEDRNDFTSGLDGKFEVLDLFDSVGH